LDFPGDGSRPRLCLFVRDVDSHAHNLVDDWQALNTLDRRTQRDDADGLLEETQEDPEHGHLPRRPAVGIDRVERVLLEEPFAQQAGHFQDQPLILWKRVGTDESNDVLQPPLLEQDAHRAVPEVAPFWIDVLLPPGLDLVDVSTVAFGPTDG